METRFQRRIEAILAPVVGSTNVHAQVTAQIDFVTREQTDDIEASISRAMTWLIDEEHYRRVRNFKQMLASYQRNCDLINVCAYAAGSDPLLDKAIALYPQMEAYLQQGIFERSGYDKACQQLQQLII